MLPSEELSETVPISANSNRETAEDSEAGWRLIRTKKPVGGRLGIVTCVIFVQGDGKFISGKFPIPVRVYFGKTDFSVFF